jgi:hypothetical protein
MDSSDDNHKGHIMRTATKSLATWLGVTAGLAGVEHGYFEILQGNIRTESLMITSIGPPCIPEEVWNACEPALTIIPNFLISGILSLLIGLLIVIWSIAFIQRKHGGLVLILLSVALLLFGGGLFPPLIGIIGGIAATRINKPLADKQISQLSQLAARMWPWPLVIFLVWIWGQWLVGYFFNDFLREVMIYGVMLILILLPLSVYSAYARDVRTMDSET